MSRFLFRRVLLTLPVPVGVATLVFSLIHLVPGDPVQAMLGESASADDIAQLRSRLGLNRPLYVQYFSFMKDAAAGDLGTSLRTNQAMGCATRDVVPGHVAERFQDRARDRASALGPPPRDCRL